MDRRVDVSEVILLSNVNKVQLATNASRTQVPVATTGECKGSQPSATVSNKQHLFRPRGHGYYSGVLNDKHVSRYSKTLPAKSIDGEWKQRVVELNFKELRDRRQQRAAAATKIQAFFRLDESQLCIKSQGALVCCAGKYMESSVLFIRHESLIFQGLANTAKVCTAQAGC